MDAIRRALLLFLFVAGAMAQTSEPPLSDSRLTIHTLVREDIFAGLLSDDMERFARGERNIQLSLQQRPAEKAELLAWQAAASVYRAARAQENGRSEEFQQKYQQGLELLSEANRLAPDNIGVAAVTGGTYAVLADRLPETPRAAAWEKSYDAYKVMWKQPSAQDGMKKQASTWTRFLRFFPTPLTRVLENSGSKVLKRLPRQPSRG